MISMRRLADLAAAAAVLPCLGVGVAALSGVGHRWVDLLAQFPAPALSVAVAALALALLARLTVAAGASGLSALVLAAAVWGQAVPPHAAPLPDSPRLTLYVANLHVENDDVDRIAASIAEADADLVVLVEVGPGVKAEIDRVLAGYPHRAPERIGWRENIVASRRPLTASPVPADGLHAQGARAETALGPVTVIAAHLTRPWPFQYQWGQITQVMALEARMAGQPGPFIAAGDFNSVSNARIGRQLKAINLTPARGFPGTWPASAPAFARIGIDHAWVSPELTVVSRRLGRPTGSDHSPIVVEIARAAP
ncbi:MAG: endonuclease/exonuclease/phosphatase family protein [Brevundimonas sp.]